MHCRFPRLFAVVAAFSLAAPALIHAQGGPPQAPPRSRRWPRRWWWPWGRGPWRRRWSRAPATPEAGAPVDLTGYWVSIVTEDWRFRMVTPAKGDYASVPISGAGRAVADMWDPAKDEAAGEQCQSYGAAGLMRVPGGSTSPGKTRIRCASIRTRARKPGCCISRRAAADAEAPP